MKRQGKTYNAKLVKIGRRFAKWGMTGMNWKDDDSLVIFKGISKKVFFTRDLCQTLGKIITEDIAARSFGDKNITMTESTACIYAAMGDRSRLDCYLEQQD